MISPHNTDTVDHKVGRAVTHRSGCSENKRCSVSDQVDRSEVKVRSESAGGRVFTTAVHWPPMTGVHSYVLRLIYNNQYLWFNASDTVSYDTAMTSRQCVEVYTFNCSLYRMGLSLQT